MSFQTVSPPIRPNIQPSNGQSSNGEIKQNNIPINGNLPLVPFAFFKTPLGEIVTIKRSMEASENKPLIWVNIKKPDAASLKQISRIFKIEYEDLEPVLSPDEPPDCFHKGDYLANHYDEYSFDPVCPEKLQSVRVNAYLKDKFLITIANDDVRSIKRVTQEISDNVVAGKKIDSSNYLFCRLFGSSIRYSDAAFKTFAKAAFEFSKLESKSLPETGKSEKVTEVKTSIFNASPVLQRLDHIIKALSEDENLFGAAKPRDNHERYTSIVNSMRTNLEVSSNLMGELRNAWITEGDRWRNELDLRLNKAMYKFGPISVYTGLAGVFSQYCDPWLIGAGAVGIIALSAYQVKFLDRRGKSMHDGPF
jgi:Mg2+ and Co2+ transporter CorA